MRIDPFTGPAAPAAPRPTPSAPGFDALLPGQAPDAPAGAGPATRAAAPTVLTQAAPLAEQAEARAVRDRAARRHGRAMLEALAGLQVAVLAGEQDTARATLADLATAAPEAADPVLRLILNEINIRAAVELARQAGLAAVQAA
jgi:hypothetical protein